MKYHLASFLLAVTTATTNPAISLCADGTLRNFILSDSYRQAFYSTEYGPEAPYSEVRFENGVIVNNCGDYIDQKKLSKVDYGDDWNTRYECDYAYCRIDMELAANGKPHNGYRPKSYAKEVFNRLDWKTVPNAGQVFENENHNTLADLKDKYIKVVDDHVVRQEEPRVWYMELKIIADADINGNGKPDWLFQKYERALGGTLFFCTSGVIYDVEPTGLLKAVEF